MFFFLTWSVVKCAFCDDSLCSPLIFWALFFISVMFQLKRKYLTSCFLNSTLVFEHITDYLNLFIICVFLKRSGIFLLIQINSMNIECLNVPDTKDEEDLLLRSPQSSADM